ncbi:cytochrome P450 83B1 [Citrus sinensis]|uniref:Cytochrome P450 83B1 n=1 Tax=Citrus sinensis TaxID=2711 RepID=A0ACB8MGI2_CITSI|nr:cytochrome P450 83B1 [Citrus sinensis]
MEKGSYVFAAVKGIEDIMALLIIVSFLLCLPFFLFFFVLQRHKTSKNNTKLPPGPRGLPFIGNLHQFDVSKPHVSFWELSKKYGPLMSLRLGFVPSLVVSSAKMAKEILKTHDLQFCSRPALVGQQKLSYNGLDLAFSPYDEYWREIRKICVIHLLNSNKVQNFRPIREDEVSRMIEKISKSVAASKLVNLSEVMMSLTSTIICRIGFGKRYDEDEATSARSRFQALLNETQALFVSFFVTDYFPFMGWIDKFTGKMQRLQNNFQELDRFYQELIDEHLDPNRTKSKLPQQEDIIDVLLQIRKDRGFKVDLTLDNIKAVLMNVFVAGTDTSAATVVWAMTYLTKNPRAMKKVQLEIRSLIGGNKGFVNEDDVQELHYLKAVVKETMRLQPTVPLLLPREAIQKCIVEGYEIPAKTRVFVNAWAIGRDPEAWQNPEEFYPERFVDSCIDFKGQNFELIPFGAGRRICPGLNMGIVTVELALANLLYKFDWEMPPGLKSHDFDVLPGLAMHKKNVLSLRAKYHVE